MPKYVVFWNAGICGTDMNSGVVEYKSIEKAVEDYYPEALEWTEQMQGLHAGLDEQMQGLHGGLDEEDMEDFDPEQYVEIWAEEYDPEKHDGLL